MLEKRETKICDNSFYHPWIKRGHPIWGTFRISLFYRDCMGRDIQIRCNGLRHGHYSANGLFKPKT